MHELSLMEAVRDLAIAQAAARGAARITAISLRIGALTAVEPDALHFAFPVVMAGTIGEGAQLLIEETEALCRCGFCGAEFPAPYGVGECPGCGTLSRELVAGRELELASLELSVEEPG